MRPTEEIAAPADVTGSYVAWYLHRQCSEQLLRWCERMRVVDPIGIGDHHCTVMYDKTRALPDHLHGTVALPWPYARGYPCPTGNRRIEVLGPRDRPGALVLLLDAPAMAHRHAVLRDQYGLRSQFLDYLPHVSLSYAFDRQDPNAVLRMVQRPPMIPLLFDRERIDHAD